MGIGGALGARYPPEGAEFHLLIFSKPFEHSLHELLLLRLLGCREGVDSVRVQGTLMRKSQYNIDGV